MRVEPPRPAGTPPQEGNPAHYVLFFTRGVVLTTGIGAGLLSRFVNYLKQRLSRRIGPSQKKEILTAKKSPGTTRGF